MGTCASVLAPGGHAMTCRDDAARLLELCGQAAAGVWLDVLRSAKDDLAIANHGQPLIIEVVLRRRCHVRLGITPLGRIVHPLSGRDPTNVRVEGDPIDVTAFLLGELTLAQAQKQGLLSVRHGVSADRLDRLRAVVASQLRSLLSDRAVVVPVTTLAWRLRRAYRVPAEWAAAAAAKAAPVVVATAAMLAGPTGATAVHAAGDSAASAVAPVIAQPAAPVAAPPVKHAASAAARARSAEGPTLEPVPPGRSVVSLQQRVAHDDSVAGRDRTTAVPVSGTINCDNWYRSLVCDAVERLPTGS